MTTNPHGTCGIHDMVLQRNDELFSKLSLEINSIRADLRSDLGAVREDIRTLSDLVSSFNLLRASHETLRKDVDYIWSDIKEIKGTVSDTIREKERLVAVATVESERYKKDIEAAHDMIRKLTTTIEKETHETRSFMVQVKSGLKMSQFLAGGIPIICAFIFWLITKLYHIGL